MKYYFFGFIIIFFSPFVHATDELVGGSLPGCDVSKIISFELGKPVDVASLNCLLKEVVKLRKRKMVCPDEYVELAHGCILKGVVKMESGGVLNLTLGEAASYCKNTFNGRLPVFSEYNEAYYNANFTKPVREYLMNFHSGNAAVVINRAETSEPKILPGDHLVRNDVDGFDPNNPTTNTVEQFRCFRNKVYTYSD